MCTYNRVYLHPWGFHTHVQKSHGISLETKQKEGEEEQTKAGDRELEVGIKVEAAKKELNILTSYRTVKTILEYRTDLDLSK